MQELRRDLERVATSIHPYAGAAMAVSRSQLARELQELIAALDRRVPHLERAEETAIARDAAKLRAQAMKRLAELTDEHGGEAAVIPSVRADASD